MLSWSTGWKPENGGIPVFLICLQRVWFIFCHGAIALLYTKNLPRVCNFQTNLGMIVLPIGVMYSSLVNRQSYGGG